MQFYYSDRDFDNHVSNYNRLLKRLFVCTFNCITFLGIFNYMTFLLSHVNSLNYTHG